MRLAQENEVLEMRLAQIERARVLYDGMKQQY